MEFIVCFSIGSESQKRYTKSRQELILASVMDAGKDRSCGAAFEFNHMDAQNAVLVYTEFTHNLSACVTIVRPCRTLPYCRVRRETSAVPLATLTSHEEGIEKTISLIYAIEKELSR